MSNVSQNFGPKHAVAMTSSRFVAGAISEAYILQEPEMYRIGVGDKQIRFIDKLLKSRDS
jgi:hypothetical protein